MNFTQSQIIDPALEMDFIYAQTLNRIGFMESREFDLYKTAFTEVYDYLQEEKKVRKPDIFLVVNAPTDVLVQRIRKRGRPYEMIMLNKYPSYLTNLRRSVEAFPSSKGIYIDTENDSYIDEVQINNLVDKIKINL